MGFELGTNGDVSRTDPLFLKYFKEQAKLVLDYRFVFEVFETIIPTWAKQGRVHLKRHQNEKEKTEKKIQGIIEGARSCTRLKKQLKAVLLSYLS